MVAAAVVMAVLSTGDDDSRVDTGAASPASPGDGGGSGGGAAVAPGQPVVNGPVTVEGAALPALPSGGTDPAIGRMFPGMSGVSVLDGSALAIPADGRPKLVVYLAHWCPHCQKEVPLLQRWIDDGGVPEGLDLYAVSTGVRADRDNFPPAGWLAEEGWTVPTLADSQDMDAARAAGLTGYPFFVGVDGDGRVVERTSGEQPIGVIDTLADQLTR